MFLISSTPTEILLLLHGDKVASIPKDDVEDFEISAYEDLGFIHFITKSDNPVRFAIPEGDDFDNAIADLIKITDGMGI
jgi:hypothetical protein